MPELDVEVEVFDPILPSRRFPSEHPGLDTWHDRSLITHRMRETLSSVHSVGKEHLSVSGGMRIEVEAVDIGVRVGSILIEKLRVLVVDQGDYDVLLGGDVLAHAFRVGTARDREARIFSPAKDDPTALAVELYPIGPPLEVRRFELFLRCQRRLHNIALLASGGIAWPGASAAAAAIDDDDGIPANLRLQITWVDSGSIWMTLKSGCKAGLEYVAGVFETGATTRLTLEHAEARRRQNDVVVAEATRQATIERMQAEQEKLKAENIAATYEVWRREVREQLDLIDDLIARVDDPAVRSELKRRKDAAIIEMTNQAVLPIVRNLPRPGEPSDGVPLLPGSGPDAGEQPVDER